MSWEVKLSAAAARDFDQILIWTTRTFGGIQALAYRETLARAMARLARGPELRGSRPRDEIDRGLRSLSVARQGRRGRHVLFYRVTGERCLEISRILHESMDMGRHIGRSFGQDDGV